jgi:hypothetical protein
MNSIVNVIFKSIPEMFEKEKDGRKPNTLRMIYNDDPRYDALKDKTATHITIENTDTKEAFMREITDISFWSGWWIISWKHEEDSTSEGKE